MREGVRINKKCKQEVRKIIIIKNSKSVSRTRTLKVRKYTQVAPFLSNK